MITVRKCVELIQNRLAGGDATMDVQGKYSYPVILEMINTVYSDIAARDRYLAREIAKSYDLTVTNNVTTLPITPLLGTQGIVMIKGVNGLIPFSQGLEESEIMSMIMPQMSVSATRLVGTTLYFNGVTNPQSTTASVTVSLIPNVSEMDEDDNLIAEGKMVDLLAMVMKLVSPLAPEEVYDNSVADTDKPTKPAN